MLDDENYRYIANGGKVIQLTVLETKVLKELVDQKGKIVSFAKLIRKAYGLEDDKSIRISLNMIIHRLRKKLKGEIIIRSIRGEGYYIPKF